ncbi:hypothetical protein niasHS_005644 [Heterodera schachtii]|uniref:SUN domain-containing protein n=1 Tax=Heterodera schachtii TaxID=97005 RepID=A0ABD2JZ07_HETSC
MYLLQLIRGYPHFIPFLIILMLTPCTDRLLSTSASLVNDTSPHSVVQSEQLRPDSPSVAAPTDNDAATPAEATNTPSSLPPVEQPPFSSLPPTHATVADDQQQQHPHPKRNYASKDCGAKVLYWNAEAENRGAILNDPERDDYMRNPCERAQNKFLIIELCETIQPTALEIANFELFSSSPRQFRVWGSERYPTQEWALIGEFEALDNREVQLFNVLEHTSYAKFVKLELLTHYGSEHYCTLSTFRMYGTSMVDEYEAETVVVVDAMQQQQHQQQMDSVFGRTFSTLPSTNSAAVNEALVATGGEEDNRQNNGTITEKTPLTTVVIHRPTEQPDVLRRCRKCPYEMTSQCDWFCHVFFGHHQNQRTTEMTKATDSSSPSATLPLAKVSSSLLMEFLNRISPIRSAICAASSIPRLKTCELNGKNGNNQKAATERTEVEKVATDEQKHTQNNQQQRQTVQGQQQQQQNQSPGTGSSTDKANDDSKSNNKNNDNSFNSGSSNIPQDAEKGAQKQPPQTPPPVQQQQTVQQPKRPTLDAKVVDKSNLTPMPGTSSTHKESVFMKLNKRLTVLEQNMSLSSEHLLELSRRCVNGAARAESELKQQREGIAKEAERMAKQEANRVETEMKQKITELQNEVRRLSQQLQSVQTTVQATGTGGFFYRPMLSPMHGYSASDSHCRGEQACLLSDAMMGTTLSPLHSTSAAPYSANSMPVSAHSTFEGKTMDGLWTTSQVVYLMLLVQLGTLVMLKLSRVLFARVLQQCWSAIAAQPFSTSAATQLKHLSTPSSAETTTTANLTDTIMNTSRHSLPLLNSSSLH